MSALDNDKYSIREDYYNWSIRSYEALRKHLGLNLRVHPDDTLLQQGDIFLFNHFARFETVIPPYIIYRATGSYTRSVADHALFDISDGLTKFLCGVGAMPNNQTGLLAFLAAEILRKRKVVMFPEGGMVKDRQVVDHAGEYGVFSHTAQVFRKHHRGAAVLALTLDIFKTRILFLRDKKDHVRLDRWCRALGLEDVRQLITRASEPTLIVPATITFYPIRVQENFLSRAVGLFAKDAPQRIAEEMLVEGNLIFRETDMDIRLNPAIKADRKWRWWERKLLNNYFKRVTSLDDLFGLRDHAKGFAERMLAKCISRETNRIRDEYMQAIYTGISVNLSHLASCMILALIRRKRMDISINDFHRLLYLALKKLQAATDIYLHRSLRWPDRYRGLLDGDNALLDRFLGTCKHAGLVGKTRNTYRFLDKLTVDFNYNEIRLENPVVVYANEVAPITEIHRIIEGVLDTGSSISERELAHFMFDDELKAHAWNREHYSKDVYREVNDAETATRSAAPYLMLADNQDRDKKPEGETVRKGVLLVHGFLAAPGELKDFGKQLHDQGLTVMGVRLAGHGTSPWDLKTRSWQDWLSSVRRGYRILSAFTDKIVVVGFSAGGALSLLMAAERPQKLLGVVSISAPYTYRNLNLAFVPLVHGINKLAALLPSFEGVMPFRENESEHPHINYHSIPIHGLYHLRLLTAELEKHLPKIDVPTLILQGDNDPVVDPSSARTIFDILSTTRKELHWVSSRHHGILYDDVGETRAITTDFIVGLGKLRGQWTRHNPPPHPKVKPVYAILDETVARMPGRPCVDFLGKVSTYAEIGESITHAAKGLQRLGLEKGDRIGLCLPNCPYYIIIYYAALKIGLTVVNFNPLYTKEEIRDQIIDSGTVLMVTLDLKTIYRKVKAGLQGTPLKYIVVCSLADALPPVKELLFRAFKRNQIADINFDDRILSYDQMASVGSKYQRVEIDPERDIALLQYTGGTTGKPKGAMLSHANITANTQQVQLWMGDVDPDGERILCAIPFFHVFAMTAAMNLGIATGSELILLPRFNLKDVLKTIDARKPTLFPAVPTIFNAISGFEQIGQYDLSSIRFCISGGAPLPGAVKANFEELTGCVVVEGYGLSETSPVLTCNPPDGPNKTDSIGLPLNWTEIEIRDIDHPERPVADGIRGILTVRGPQVMAGYWGNPVETSAALRDGWLITGDVGYRDDDGYLFLTDRLSDVIICSGFKVYPRVIEEVFYQHSDVEEVVVIGIDDDYRGQSPMAFVKLKAGASIDGPQLLDIVAQNLNPIERPVAVEIRNELPKTMIGKLSKKELVAENRS